ncbi:hypothetical protein QVD17_06693 [Tagetes erecta]|uniref:Glycosyltransferase n=1 Tax=Tagetes erecta TaxID=13708 RepID=A0AAD8LL51_TARER|nr:hypothetical protein QVD17_06693 [Tagetes erecta]
MASPLPVRPHIVMFPFMAKGHTIPLLHLTRLLVNRGTIITLFTTKSNHPFISHFLKTCPHGRSISILDLPFPSDIEGVPQGIESTDKLPSNSLFPQFVVATKLMRPHFEQMLEKIYNDVTCIISDAFLNWTLASANKFGIPRMVYFGMSGYVTCMNHDVGLKLWEPGQRDAVFTHTRFPWIKVMRNDFDELITADPPGPHVDFLIEVIIATRNSYGLIMNSFYELEPLFLDYLYSETKPKPWCVGPLCLADSPMVTHDTDEKSRWIRWLDQKLANGISVLYVAFGSQAEISTRQIEAISKGLEESEVNFLWVVRKCETNVLDELEERVGDRGMIVKEWVDQIEILKHESVNGFLSHCGWNSVLESICSGVPILAWPMMAEQPLNARMVVEEIKIGLRVATCDGTIKGFVKPDGLKKVIKELMEGEKGKELREKVKEVSAAAKEAMADGGSSWRTLNELMNELLSKKTKQCS